MCTTIQENLPQVGDDLSYAQFPSKAEIALLKRYYNHRNLTSILWRPNRGLRLTLQLPVVQEIKYSWPHQSVSIKCLDKVEYQSDRVDHVKFSGHAKRVSRIQLVCAYKCGWFRYKDLSMLLKTASDQLHPAYNGFRIMQSASSSSSLNLLQHQTLHLPSIGHPSLIDDSKNYSCRVNNSYNPN